jgi:hypothetical protein
MASYDYQYIGIKNENSDKETITQIMECLKLEKDEQIDYLKESNTFINGMHIKDFMWFKVGYDSYDYIRICNEVTGNESDYGRDDAADLFELMNMYIGKTEIYLQGEEGQTSSDTYMGVDEHFVLNDDGTAVFRAKLHSYSYGYPYDFGNNGYINVKRNYFFRNGYDKLLKQIRKNARAKGYTNILKLLKTPVYAESIKSDTETVYSEDGKTLVHVATSIEGVFNVPEGVETIGDNAFFGCDKITIINLPDSLRTIGKYAFAYCEKLYLIPIPQGVTKIGEGTFRECKTLRSVAIPEGVTELPEGAFTDILFLQLPKAYNDYKIQSEILDGCRSIYCIGIDDGEGGFRCSQAQHVRSLPDQFVTINGKIVDTISTWNIKTLQLSIKTKIAKGILKVPYGVTKIEHSSFSSCSYCNKGLNKVITKVELPDTLEEIDSRTFENWELLEEINIPDSVVRIAPNAFAGCPKLKLPEYSIKIENGVLEKYTEEDE